MRRKHLWDHFWIIPPIDFVQRYGLLNRKTIQNMAASTTQDARNLALSQAIHTILDRRGIGQRQHRTALEAALGMQYQQVRRRMTGEKTWSIGELARLAAHFGESAFELIAILMDEQGQSATLQIDGSDTHCTIWPGEILSKERPRGPLVAVASEPAGAWIVIKAADAGSRPTYEIKRLILEASPRNRVAIVDADADWAETVVEYLRRKGLEAVNFCSFEHARAAIETSQYDGFIIDWSFGPEPAEALLRTIREKTQGPVLLVSNPRHEEVEEIQELDRLTSLVAEHGAQFYEKSANTFGLYSALEHGFRLAKRGGTQ